VTTAAAPPAASDFIRAKVVADLASGKDGGRVATRFPPEPNGYLHIGHAKSICLNFGVAAQFGGTCNLRYDDTNPATEDPEYVEAIQGDVHWLGFDWEDRLYYASDYFGPFYDVAEKLVREGRAYVDSLSEDEIREYRGTVTEPGRESPYRGRSVAENLDLFRRMRAGEFADGAHVLRAKIDMAAANMKMRDPLLYRIRHASHYRTGDAWCIYPMYDWAHPLSDALEGITHSLCTLEFENNREVYDWVVAASGLPNRPEQTEFARLNLTYTVLSKRRLLELVKGGHVAGWDDPRMPTLSGLRRRGCTPEAIRDFCERVGVARSESTVDVALLEHSLRDDLNQRAPRVMGVLRPLRLVVENYPEGESEELEAPYWPHDVPREGSRKVPFSRVLYVEREDFAAEPPRKWHRLAPGREVRLRYGYLVRCTGFSRDEASGEVTEVRCTYDPATRGGAAPDGRQVAGTIHWVSAAHSLPAEVRLYDRLFTVERPDLMAGKDFKEALNPGSLEVLTDSRIEPALAAAEPGSRFQFERLGYFYLDPESAGEPEGAGGGRLVFNRIVTLKDTWAQRRAAAGEAEPEAREAPAEEPSGAAPAAPAVAGPGPGPRPLTAGQEELARRYRDESGLAEPDARLLASEPELAAFFDEAVAAHPNPQGLANWIVNELLREVKERPLAELPLTPAGLAELVALLDAGTISTPIAKEVFAELAAAGGSPREIVEARGLSQLSDAAALEPVVDRVLAAHPQEVAAYREGKDRLLGFFVGRVMAATGGRANPRLVNELVLEKLKQ
jgi:glutaminyl-tRNA synthetase